MENWEAETELSHLLHAFSQWIDAKKDRDDCYTNCDISPGYHCASYDNDVKDCEAEFGNKLGKVIDRRVKNLLIKTMDKPSED